MKAAGSLVADIRSAYLVGDAAYDATALRDQLRRQRCRSVIPSNPTRKIQRRHNRTLYRLRHRVENFFQRLKRFRRIATRYDKLAASFFGMVCFAAVLTWVL